MAADTPLTTNRVVRRPGDERAAAQQAMLMREVDEAVRQDEAATAARKYGLVVAAAVVLILALFAGWLYWQNRHESSLERGSENLIGAVDQLGAGNDAEAETRLKALEGDASPAGAAAARLMRAGIAVQQNRAKDAVALYNGVAADTNAPGPYRDFATIRAVLLGYDDMKPQQVIDRLGPLAVPANPWYGTAGELVALAYLAQGKKQQAGPLLAAIARNDTVPETLRARTRQLSGLLGYDAVDDVDKTLAALAQDSGSAQGAPAAPAAPEQAPAAQ